MRRMRGSTRVLLVSTAAWVAMLGAVALGAYGGDFRGFFVAGTVHPAPPALVGWPVVAGPGYDGQFFATLSTDPLLLSTETARGLDVPSYRAGRIGLPLAAWALALGRPALAPLLYLLLCWIGGLLGIWVAARWMEDRGRSPWAALPLAISGGLLASMSRGLPDAAAGSLVLLALWLEERRTRFSTPTMAFATLVRETSLIGAGAVALARWRAGERWAAASAIAAPLAVVLGWRAWVSTRPGYPAYVTDVFAMPLSWIPAKVAPPWTADSVAEAAALVALATGLAAWLALLPSWRRWSALAWVYAGFCVLALLVGDKVYADRWAHSRIVVAMPLLAVPLSSEASGAVATRLLRVVPWAWAAAGVLSIVMSTRIGSILTNAIAR